MNIDRIYSQAQCLADMISDWETQHYVTLPAWECDDCERVYPTGAAWCPACNSTDRTLITEDVLERRFTREARG